MVDEHLYRRRNGGAIKIGADAAALIWSHAQTDDIKPEAGGLLLGRQVSESNDVIVDRATPPSAKDRATRFRFFRAKGPANRAIRKYWEGSSGTCNYLGEWHSHPENVPVPSCIDYRNWRRLLIKSVIDQDFLLFVIVGRVELRLWELRAGSKSPELLERVASSPGEQLVDKTA